MDNFEKVFRDYLMLTIKLAFILDNPYSYYIRMLFVNEYGKINTFIPTSFTDNKCPVVLNPLLKGFKDLDLGKEYCITEVRITLIEQAMKDVDRYSKISEKTNTIYNPWLE